MHKPHHLSQAFAALGLEPPILRALDAMGFEEPSPVQRELIPVVLSGKDVLGQARTGTGKTAAFGLPILQRIDPTGRLQAIVLTPTRELAVQVLGEFRRMAQFTQVHCVPVYGGTGMKQQLHQLGRKPHVVVGTPGRVMDMMGRGAMLLDGIRFVVLDEVDRMLDIGFRDDIRRILGAVKHPHQTVLVSATLDDEIKRLANQYMHDAVEINVSHDELTVEGVRQQFCVVDPWDKFKLLRCVMAHEKPKLTIIFCNTRHGARKLARRLFDAGIEAKEIHGDLVQQKRERIMDRFRKHQIPVLVATDLAARGIDVHEITHIINYDLPQDISVYVHRIGRTARMGATGLAVTFVTREEGSELTEIEKLINKELHPWQVPGFTPSPPPRDSAFGPSLPGPAAAPAITAAPPSRTVSGPNLAGKFPLRRRRR
ncbi:MAG TPA: DEAD/DEAH box helicase [Phycisphaerae bacterium]|nr:DEAD/DEAH box helicase [Phycisphaerae bacterium]